MRLTGLKERARQLYAKLRHRLLVKERRQYQQALRGASIGMTRIRSLPKLLNLIARVTVASVRISHATIFLRNRGEADFTAAVSRGKLKKPIDEVRVQESAALVALMIQRRKSIVYEELKPGVRVVIITGYESTDVATEAINLGADDYITKPFRQQKIRTQIRTLLDSKGA